MISDDSLLDSREPGPSLGDALAPDVVAPTVPLSRRDKAILAAFAVAVVALVCVPLRHSPSPAAPAHPQPLLGSQEGAIHRPEDAVKVAPDTTKQLQLSLAYINAGQPGRAVPILQALLDADRTNVAAWNNLCVAHTMTRDLQMAVGECGRALALDPSYQLAQNNLRWARSETQLEMDAVTKMDQVPIPDRDAAFYITQGTHLLHVGNYNEAIGAWQHTLSLDARNGSAANNIGLAYMLQNQPDKAIEWFAKALQWEGNKPHLQNNMAWALDVKAKIKASPTDR